jgi:multicomponent Na+:H+ antiporter subunit E
MSQGHRSLQAPGSDSQRRPRGTRSLIILILFLVVLWLVFSGKFDALHLGYGVVSIILVTIMCRGLLTGPSDRPENEVLPRINWLRALAYPWWLLVQIMISNLHVALLIVNPRLTAAPVLLEFRSGLQSDLARLTLGNSITLTPGTLTLRVEDDVFLVHALRPDLASGLIDGSMQHMVAAVYGEPRLPVAEMQVRVIDDPDAWLEAQA